MRTEGYERITLKTDAPQEKEATYGQKETADWCETHIPGVYPSDYVIEIFSGLLDLFFPKIKHYYGCMTGL